MIDDAQSGTMTGMIPTTFSSSSRSGSIPSRTPSAGDHRLQGRRAGLQQHDGHLDERSLRPDPVGGDAHPAPGYTKEDDEAQRQGAAEQEQLDALLAETAARMHQMLRTDVPSAIVRPYDIATDR